MVVGKPNTIAVYFRRVLVSKSTGPASEIIREICHGANSLLWQITQLVSAENIIFT
ncbi:MAG: hypothetical protein LBD34_00640 [Puniceicoccales bacterium]|nr:hypothetical protein [Puniceicoccales bacterium]